MDRPSSSSPRRDVSAPQDDEIELIASQMEWHNEHSVGDQSGNDRSDDVGDESGDDQGPRIGEGAWQGNLWVDPVDPHPVAQRERRLDKAIDPDYEPEQRQEAPIGRSKHRRLRPSPTEEDNESSGPDPTTSDSQKKGDEVNEEETSTLKGSSPLMKSVQQESP